MRQCRRHRHVVASIVDNVIVFIVVTVDNNVSRSAFKIGCNVIVVCVGIRRRCDRRDVRDALPNFDVRHFQRGNKYSNIVVVVVSNSSVVVVGSSRRLVVATDGGSDVVVINVVVVVVIFDVHVSSRQVKRQRQQQVVRRTNVADDGDQRLQIMQQR
jgi:hypothetical protein